MDSFQIHFSNFFLSTKISLGNSQAVQWLGLRTLSLPRARVQSLLRELKSHKLGGAAKREKKKKKNFIKKIFEGLVFVQWLSIHLHVFEGISDSELIPFFIIRKDSNSERLKTEKWFFFAPPPPRKEILKPLYVQDLNS